MKKKKRDYRKFYTKPEWLIPLIIGIILWVISFNNGPKENFVTNSTNVAIIQESSDVTITQVSGQNGNPCQGYTKEIELENLGFKRFGFTIDLYNVKFILKNNQEGFIKKFIANKHIKIACCNDATTDCYIYYEYKIPEKYKVCFVHTFFEDNSNKIYLGQDFDQNCYKVVNGSPESGAHKFNELPHYTE